MNEITTAQPAALTSEQRDEIIAKAVEALAAGKSLAEIGSEHGVPKRTIHLWLMRETGEKYREIQEAGLIARVLIADEELEAARDHVSISRARERCRFYRWDLERRVKRLFSPSTEVSGPGGGPIQYDVDELARRYAFIKAMSSPRADPIDVETIPQAVVALPALDGATEVSPAPPRVAGARYRPRWPAST